MTIFPDPLKYRQLHRLMVCISVFIVAGLGWYVIMRIVHPHFRVQVKVINLYRQPVQEMINPSELRVGCYNIVHGRGESPLIGNFGGGRLEDKFDRLKQTAKLFHDHQLDIVVLNQVDFAAAWSHHVNQAELIARFAAFKHVGQQRNYDISFPFCHFRFGNAILSKYPILRAEAVQFPPYSQLEKWFGGSHDALLCSVKLPDDTIVNILGVHLEPRSEAVRVRSAQKIIKLAQQSTEPMIIMGTFYSTPSGFPGHNTDETGKNAMDVLIQSGLFRIMPVQSPPVPADLTYPAAEPQAVIDWILVKKPWIIHDKQILSTDISDHLPVTAVLSP